MELAADERRGIAELNGEGEVVSGVAIARSGENTLAVIDNLKAKIVEISSGLPEGVAVRTVCDRSDLIHRAIATLKTTLIEESIIVALVCIVFLFHVRSVLVAIVMLQIGVLIAFLAMQACRCLRWKPRKSACSSRSPTPRPLRWPALLEMFETVINLKPQDQLIAEMDTALKFPGIANSWTMPIKARIDMLSTGIRTPVGIKVFGKDLQQIETVARDIERVVRSVPGTTSAYIYVDLRDRDIGSYVRDAQQAVAEQVTFPPGTYANWSGQFEYMQRAQATMKVVIPLTLGIIFLLLYLNFRRVTESMIVMFSVPFALVGGVWLTRSRTTSPAQARPGSCPGRS